MDADRGAASPGQHASTDQGLYVADGSLWPEPPAVNPMLTIIAMAARVSRQIAARAT